VSSAPEWNKDSILSSIVVRKLDHPNQFPTMTVKETMQAIGISRATTYRWVEEGRLERASLNKPGGTRKAVRIKTISVIRALSESED
jgi:Helix-turn-helix domain